MSFGVYPAGRQVSDPMVRWSYCSGTIFRAFFIANARLITMDQNH